MSLRVDTIQNESGTGPVELYKQSAAKAWGYISFGGASIVVSLNLSSVTDNGTGNYEIAYTSAMSSGDYCCPSGGGDTNMRAVHTANKTTSNCDLEILNSSGSFADADPHSSIIGDLA